MSLNLLYGCCQVETSTGDLSATRSFMIDQLGAGRAEQTLAREIRGIIADPAYDVDHLELGEAIFQINQPSPTMSYNGYPSIHRSYLDRVGPCVTNLNFFIDDHLHAQELLQSLGAPTYIRGPSSAAPSLADYGSGNTRPGVHERPFLFMGTRHLIGLDLEIMEPNFLRFSQQTVQYPAFVRPRPKAGDGNLRLERLLVVVEGLEATLDSLALVFAPASRSRPYAYRESDLTKSFRMTLGGIEIEYCQPRTSTGYFAEALRQFGPGVAAIEFSARDIAKVVGKVAADDQAPVEEDFGDSGMELEPCRRRLRCRTITGFDIVLSPCTDHRRALIFEAPFQVMNRTRHHQGQPSAPMAKPAPCDSGNAP